jgi:hypothetical protein
VRRSALLKDAHRVTICLPRKCEEGERSDQQREAEERGCAARDPSVSNLERGLGTCSRAAARSRGSVPAAAVQAFLRGAFIRNLGDGPCDPTRLHFTVPAHGDIERPFDSCAFGLQFATPAAGRSSRSHLRHQRRQLRTLGLFRKKLRRAVSFVRAGEFCVRGLSFQAQQSPRDTSSLRRLEIWSDRGLPSGRQPYSQAGRYIGRQSTGIRSFSLSLWTVWKGRMA